MGKFFSADDVKRCATSEEKDFARIALAAGLTFRYEPKIPNCVKRCDFVFYKPISIFFVEGNEEIYAIEIKRGARRSRRDKEQHIALRKNGGLHTLIFTRRDIDLLLLGGFDGKKLPKGFKYKKKFFSKDACPICGSTYVKGQKTTLGRIHAKEVCHISSSRTAKRKTKIRKSSMKKKRRRNKKIKRKKKRK